MPWVIDPELQGRRQRILDLLTLARAETSFMESASEDLLRETVELVAGTPLGDKAAYQVRASISHIGSSTANIDDARVSARQINIRKWVPESESDMTHGRYS